MQALYSSFYLKFTIMSKYFFLTKDDERCYTKKWIQDQIREHGFNELKVFAAERQTGFPYFFCSYFSVVGEVGESCGKGCYAYAPRNGKSGICKHYRNCYAPGEEVVISA